MHIVYTLQDPPLEFSRSIFLAGPSPRDENQETWRPTALSYLEQIGYDGVVFVPEYENPDPKEWANQGRPYQEQVDWEEKCLNMSDQIVFWVPRDMDSGMFALTTNVEWGKWQALGKCILAAPAKADHVRYLFKDAERLKAPRYPSLKFALLAADRLTSYSSYRVGGERCVPLHVWNLPHFQRWLQSQKKVGNRLDEARLLWQYPSYPSSGGPFIFSLWVNMWVADEKRHKRNEFVLSRPDIVTVVAYKTPNDSLDWAETEVLLVREYRSPARNSDGFIRECPGGSIDTSEEAVFSAVRELMEETGLAVDGSRLKFVGTRQVAGTLSAHTSTVYSLELTDWEFQFLKEQAGKTHGERSDSERTYVELHPLISLFSNHTLDWGTLGQICGALI